MLRGGIHLTLSVLTVAIFVFVAHSAHAETNLLTNGDFATGDSTGWTIVDNGGSGSTFNEETFNTSHQYGSITQTVDLVDAGYSTAILDAAPSITFNVQTLQRFDHAGEYYLEYKLFAEDGSTIIAQQLYGSAASPIYLNAGTDWFDTEYTFTGYGAGARYAFIKIAGRDDNINWAGQYGPYFDNASITLVQASQNRSKPVEIPRAIINAEARTTCGEDPVINISIFGGKETWVYRYASAADASAYSSWRKIVPSFNILPTGYGGKPSTFS